MKNCQFILRQTPAHRALYLACAAAFTASPVYAQSAEIEPTQLPTVVVTASRLPQTLPDTIANTTLITRADIERSAAVDLPALLAGQAGIEIARNGSAGQVASIFMRGASSSHTLVLLDGVAINDNNFGTARLELIALETIDRVEIVRGNVSAQYGSQAIGGVIQLFSRRPAAGLNGTASVELGTQGHQKIAATLAGGNTDTQFRVSASAWTLKGVSALNSAQSPTANPDKDGTQQNSIQASVSHTVSPTLKLSASLSHTKQLSDYDGNRANKRDTTDQSLSLAQLGGQWAVMPQWTMKFKAVGQKGLGHDETDNVASSDVSSKRQVLSWVNEIDAGLAGTLLAGLEQERDQFAAQSYGTYGSQTTTPDRKLKAVFAGLQGKQRGISWNLALRRDSEQGTNGNLANHANTYQVGLAYDVSPAWSVRGQTSTAFNRPTMAQLYTPDYGNVLLKSELAKNKELGVQWMQGGHLVRATYFKNQVDHLIGFDPQTYQNINVDKSSNQGLELLAELAMPWPSGKLKMGLTQQKPIDDTTGLILQRRNKQQANMGLQGSLGAWLWGAQLTYQGARNDVKYSEFTSEAVVLNSYLKLDAQVSYTLNSRLSGAFSLVNMSNGKDQSAYGYSGTPRGAMLRLNYKL
jgi:vitamin B12 transporter